MGEVARIVDLTASADGQLQRRLRIAWRSLQRPVEASDSLTQTIKQLERSAEQARSRLTSAAVLLVDGTLDKAGYERLRDKAQADLEAAEEELSRQRRSQPRPSMPSLDVVLREAGNWERVLGESNVPARRRVLATLIDHVIPTRIGRFRCSVRIVWSPLGAALLMLSASARSVA